MEAIVFVYEKSLSNDKDKIKDDANFFYSKYHQLKEQFSAPSMYLSKEANLNDITNEAIVQWIKYRNKKEALLKQMQNLEQQ